VTPFLVTSQVAVTDKCASVIQSALSPWAKRWEHVADRWGEKGRSGRAKVPLARLARVVERARHHLYRLHQRLVPAPDSRRGLMGK
jgi:hypothetical protein